AGTRRLAALLANECGPAPTRSEAERRLRALIDAAGLPRPLFNARLHGFEVDALWPSLRVVVEVDGFAFHAHRGAFERDRRRDQRLVAAGYTVIRITWRQLAHEPLGVVARLAQALALAQARAGAA
ncbi:MAG: endonuclease domain-containing protein, partial [Solirubrobacteraceae bacterium]